MIHITIAVEYLQIKSALIVEAHVEKMGNLLTKNKVSAFAESEKKSESRNLGKSNKHWYQGLFCCGKSAVTVDTLPTQKVHQHSSKHLTKK